jgi:anthranilate synthase component 1
MELLRATFPAGTVTGAPKVRAMEIIDELEPRSAASTRARRATRLQRQPRPRDRDPHRRREGRQLYVQAAAGIVADSIPENEWRETQNKVRAVLAAAEAGARGARPSAGRTGQAD